MIWKLIEPTIEIMEKFEAGMYNQEVGDLVEKHLHHNFLEDVWAHINYIGITAKDEKYTRKRLERQYSESQGLKIEAILLD